MCCKSKYRGNYTRAGRRSCGRHRAVSCSTRPRRQLRTAPTILPPVQSNEITVSQVQVFEKTPVDDMFSYSEPPSYNESQLKTMNIDHIDLPESVRKYSSSSTLEGMTIPLSMLGKYSGPVSVYSLLSPPSARYE